MDAILPIAFRLVHRCVCMGEQCLCLRIRIARHHTDGDAQVVGASRREHRLSQRVDKTVRERREGLLIRHIRTHNGKFVSPETCHRVVGIDST